MGLIQKRSYRSLLQGYTMVDEIAELLGLPLIPADSQSSGDQVLHGVNYASAAAGILDITGRNFQRLPQQLSHAKLPYPEPIQQPTIRRSLTQQYTRQLTSLYNLGARKFILNGIGLMGCIPSILSQNTSGRCSDEVNNLVVPFNANVNTMMNSLTATLPGSKFIYIDVRRMFQDILSKPGQYGFTVIDRGCCGIGRNSGQITCLPFQTPCMNRKQYVFWDAFHPTEEVNIIMARKVFSGGTDVVYPMNIQQLATLSIEPN
ncbi:hypothetical protein GIB67_009044 [Kingdonia uniflora]|uniref:GDSL esterase/lipase n=1 Tax=Kingdonia uniflora TaxID=39325 RepID=A0A7J7N5K3_9MAGN|nr:hypothetical protein GIB67_009044 [Kingdonia uniflora]